RFRTVEEQVNIDKKLNEETRTEDNETKPEENNDETEEDGLDKDDINEPEGEERQTT
ncbi:unnamed protein product, partial [Rotaria magnacalcarata]